MTEEIKKKAAKMGVSAGPKVVRVEWDLELVAHEGAIIFDEVKVAGLDEAGCVWRHRGSCPVAGEEEGEEEVGGCFGWLLLLLFCNGRRESNSFCFISIQKRRKKSSK